MISIYAGTEDYVDFFLLLVKKLNLDIEYRIVDVDGELEIEVKLK